MDRTMKWLFLVAGCVAVLAIAYWQVSSDATLHMAPAVMELKPAVATVNRYDVAPVAPSKDEAAVGPMKNTASAPTTKPVTKAPASNIAPPVIQRDAPAANTVERRENALPPSAPKANKSPAEAYEAMARTSLQNKDYDQARQHIESALAHGGKATFMLVHDHSRGNFETDDPKATCVGELRVLADGVRFEAINDGDRFSSNWADVREAGSNRFFGSGRGGFHVTIAAGGKYKNFNLAPESKEKAEAKLILDLLNSYTRRSDQTK